MPGLAIRCVYCEKPLLDTEHARVHVVNQCEASPSKKLADALELELKRNCFGEEHCSDEAHHAARAALRAAGRIQ